MWENIGTEQEALKALNEGKSVMVYTDNLSQCIYKKHEDAKEPLTELPYCKDGYYYVEGQPLKIKEYLVWNE